MDIENQPFDNSKLPKWTWMQIILSAHKILAKTCGSDEGDESNEVQPFHFLKYTHLESTRKALQKPKLCYKRRLLCGALTTSGNHLGDCWRVLPWHHTRRILAVSNNYVMMAKSVSSSALNQETFTLFAFKATFKSFRACEKGGLPSPIGLRNGVDLLPLRRSLLTLSRQRAV